MKKIKVLLWMFACIFVIGCTATANAEDTSEEKQFTYDESYTKRSFADLLTAGELKWDDSTEFTVVSDTSNNGLMIKGSAEALNEARFTIDRTFCFSGNRVGRVSVDALAGKSENLTIDLYLDNETDSFASISLTRQGRSDDWTKVVCMDQDVLDQGIKGNHSISFSIENKAGGTTAVLIRSLEFVESSLPTVYMNIDESLGAIEDMNNSSDHSKECYGSVTIETPSGYTYEYGENAGQAASEDTSVTYELDYLRGRGNSTWSTIGKKPYKFKLESKANLFGMGSSKHWILMANAMDDTKLKNRMTYQLGADAGLSYTPESIPVDLVMNGVYYGSYYLCEQIRVESSRVDIDDLEKDDDTKAATDPETISGGYLLSYVCGDVVDEGLTTFSTEKGMKMALESPSFDGYENETQLNYIKDYVQKMENALTGTGHVDEDGVSYTEYMDLDSTVNYFLIEMIASDEDAYTSDSTYLYKKRDGKLYWGPLWDYDLAWTEDLVEAFHFPDDAWINNLRTDSTFVNALHERWPVLKQLLLDYCADGGLLDQYYQEMEISMRYDVEKWGFYTDSTSSDDSGDDLDGDYETYSVEESSGNDTQTPTFYSKVEELKEIVKARVAWVDENFDQLEVNPCTITYVVNGKTYAQSEVLPGNALSADDLPVAPTKKGYVFLGWSGDGGDTYVTAGAIIYDDETLTAIYISEKDVIAPKELYLSETEIWDYTDDLIHIDYSVYPENYTGTVTFASDNPAVATIDENGDINTLAEGDAVITYSVGTLKKKCTIHVAYAHDIDPDQTMALSKSSLTLSQGKHQQITITYNPKAHVYQKYEWISADESIASVDSCGVITACSPGTTYIMVRDPGHSILLKCKVTVPKPASTVKKGYTYTYRGLKYKVTYKAKKGGNVTILGPTGKKIKSVNIRSTLKIKGETYKVTGISYKAFYNCKNLRKITMGNNIKTIGNKAFTGIYKKAVFKVPASKKKAYKKLLTSKKGFRKTMKVKK